MRLGGIDDGCGEGVEDYKEVTVLDNLLKRREEDMYDKSFTIKVCLLVRVLSVPLVLANENNVSNTMYTDSRK